MYNVFVLTSSRADFGIYRPLLKILNLDKEINLQMVVFGSHLYQSHGYTINEIEQEGYSIIKKIEHNLKNDSANEIASNMGLVSSHFADFWNKIELPDLVLALGDRFEMFSAVSSLIPLQIPIAHIHGGETTLGAIDNVFRHSISLASKLHFVATKDFANRLENLLDSKDGICNVGALSLDNIEDLNLLNKSEFKNQFEIEISDKSVLVTFHPETVKEENNVNFIMGFKKLCSHFTDYQFIIGLPNADSNGQMLRDEYIQMEEDYDNVITFEHLGTLGYFSAISLCQVVFGNSSSGIIEVASFNKYVINVGDRQKGRVQSGNTINSNTTFDEMKTALEKAISNPRFVGDNKYKTKGQKRVSELIHEEIKKYLFG